jgi:hypothetical protein
VIISQNAAVLNIILVLGGLNKDGYQSRMILNKFPSQLQFNLEI